MNDKRTIEYYCTGCGLCERGSNVPPKYVNGFYSPEIEEGMIHECKGVCPSYGTMTDQYLNNDIYGNYKEVWEGFSTDEQIRFHASSGGSLTALSLYLLESKMVDGIIHSVADSEIPWRTKTVCSRSKEELVRRCGSRYTQSSPLRDFEKLIVKGEKYAFIGKPCDVYSLNKYLEKNEELKKSIVVTMSFFCAGQPSEKANTQLVRKLLGDEADSCHELTYRGNGWPGQATAISTSGKTGSISYEESWGKIQETIPDEKSVENLRKKTAK